MRRERFKTARVCSSDNYALSKKLHKQELSKNHCKLQEMLIKEEIVLKKVAYIKVFDKFIPLSSMEITLYEGKTEIIYK